MRHLGNSSSKSLQGSSACRRRPIECSLHWHGWPANVQLRSGVICGDRFWLATWPNAAAVPRLSVRDPRASWDLCLGRHGTCIGSCPVGLSPCKACPCGFERRKLSGNNPLDPRSLRLLPYLARARDRAEIDGSIFQALPRRSNKS